ncbi:hypothetical protein Cmtc_41680 [Cupriavidus sp. TKC]|nr:hypothetical protein Cmtc_41680 [Cupriavidus sp. TKC]
MGKLFEEPDILEQGGATRAGGLNVLVIDNGRAKCGRELIHSHSLMQSCDPEGSRLDICGTELPRLVAASSSAPGN